jgi:hypothetical protein
MVYPGVFTISFDAGLYRSVHQRNGLDVVPQSGAKQSASAVAPSSQLGVIVLASA